MKVFIVTKSSVMETQNLVVHPKSEPVKSKSKQYQFLFKSVLSKNQLQNLQNENKLNHFFGRFSTKAIFLKSSG